MDLTPVSAPTVPVTVAVAVAVAVTVTVVVTFVAPIAFVTVVLLAFEFDLRPRVYKGQQY